VGLVGLVMNTCGGVVKIQDIELAHQMWAFTSGVILVLLQSILTGARRNWVSLIVGCLIGGAGAWVAGQIWGDSKYIYIICGVAAIITENLLIGVTNASQEFAEKPFKVMAYLGRTFLPAFGRQAGGEVNEEDVK